MVRAGDGQFGIGLSKCLARTGDFVLEEVGRLRAELAELREENARLRLRIAACLPPDPDGVKPGPGGAGAPALGEQAQGRRPERPAPGAEGVARPRSGSLASADLILRLPGDGSPGRPSRRRAPPGEASSDGGGRPVQRLVRGQAFENVTLGVTLLNTLWVGVDADANGRPLLDSPPLFQAVEHAFAAIFTLELAARLAALESPRRFLADGWLLLDGLLVPLMALDTWLLPLLVLLTGQSALGGFGALSVVRLLRLVRIVRVARICRAVPELHTMVGSMVAGLRSVLLTASLLLVMTYACALFMRQLSASSAIGEEIFPSVPRAVYVLLIQSLFPDHGDLLTEIFQERWYCGVIFFVFLVLSAFMVVNMLVALLCDVVGKQSQDELHQRSISTLSDKLKSILESIDENYDGMVSRAEFEKIMEHEPAVKLLQDLGVDVDALVDESEFIFSTKGKSQLTLEAFKEEVLQFRTSNFATMGTITATRRFIRLSLEQIARKIVRLEGLVCEAGAGRPGPGGGGRGEGGGRPGAHDEHGEDRCSGGRDHECQEDCRRGGRDGQGGDGKRLALEGALAVLPHMDKKRPHARGDGHPSAPLRCTDCADPNEVLLLLLGMPHGRLL